MPLHFKRASVLAPALLVLFASIAPLRAQQPSAPQTGVYHCTNGSTLTISSCEKWNGIDACNFKMENKGQVLMDSPGAFEGVAKMIRLCKGEAAAAQSAPPPPARPRATDPAYLADMPSADRVKNEIKGSDPTDTMARQVAVFTALGQYIMRIKSSRSIRNPYTPDESALMSAYSLASYQITQEYAKSHTAAEANAFTGMHWKYEMGPADDWARKLMGNQSTSAYTGALGSLQASGKAHYDQEMRDSEAAKAQQQQGNNSAGPGGQHYATDAGSVAARHCLESGRGEMECLGLGMNIGASEFFGANPSKGAAPQAPSGLRLSGLYSASNFELQFKQDTVGVKCGALIEQPLPYSVERTGNQIVVRIPIQPKPLTLSYRADGNLAGPGPIDVNGKAWVAGVVEVSPISGPTPNRVWVHRDEMSTTAKTERCNVATLPPTGANPSDTGGLSQVLGMKPSQSTNTTPGLRLNGTYAAPGGLRIEFRDDSATLGCGDSLNSEAYDVIREGGQMIVHFQNSTGPLSLVLQPNGVLTGSGTVDVAGRKAIHAPGAGVDYVAKNARCAVGTLQAAR